MIDQILRNYSTYKEKKLKTRRIKHSDVVSLIEKLDSRFFSTSVLGESFEGRNLYLIKYGIGKRKIFFWSQMHGNESTATRALFDFINFLSAEDEYNDLRNEFKTQFSLYFLPMVNPDGAERYKRRNAVDIDLNRDARAKESPESRLLWQARNEIDADFGFNLHDQASKYNVGSTNKNSKISFLAPAVDSHSSEPEQRILAMKMIAFLRNELEELIPGHISNYDDAFGPRCFGEQFQMSAMPTVLIESGYNHNDLEREEIRKLNFYLYVIILDGILRNKISMYKTEDYHAIAMNKEKYFDIIIRSAAFQMGPHKYMMDIGYRREEINISGAYEYYPEFIIEDVGDLDGFYGHDEFDASSYTVKVGKSINMAINKLNKLSLEDEIQLISRGYTSVRSDQDPDLIICKDRLLRYSEADAIVETEQKADLIFYRDNIVEKAFINGKIVDIENF